MKRVHLLRTELAAEAFAELFAEIHRAGLRAGWLDLTSGSEESSCPDPALEAAAAAGVLRAVSVSESRVVSVKPVRGPSSLANLLREYFRGCQLVIVRGPVEAPEVARATGGWTIRQGTEVRTLATEALCKALRKPRLPGFEEPTLEAERPE